MSSVQSSPVVNGRDLRIDFLRGFVMFILVIAHTEIFSIYNLIAWERIGLVSGAGGFVMLSGFVVGMVYGGRVRKAGTAAAAESLFRRALQLYRVNVFIIASILLLRWVSIADVKEVTTFTDRAAQVTYPLFTDPAAPLSNKIFDVLFLRSGPHQIQVLGLYVVLLFISPLALWLLASRRTVVLLALSWGCYVWSQFWPTRLTVAQFENAFPLLAWQVYYFNAMAAGYHRSRAGELMRTRAGRAVLWISVVFAAAFFFLAQNTTNAFVPAWARLSLIDAGTFTEIHARWFEKNPLRIGRVINWFALIVVARELVVRYWARLNRVLGWFFVPLGQASLYVFIVHVYLVLLVSNIVPFGFSIPPEHILRNTVAHSAMLAALWLMVRYQVLFGWVPR